MPHPSARRRLRGFTLIETMVTVGVAGVLSSIAYPSLEGHVLRARRTDALVALMNAQLAQERYRANNIGYGGLVDIGVRASSMSGHYALQVTTSSSDGFVLLASATGAQSRDAACRHLRLSSLGTGIVYASGPDTATGNDDGANRKCWSR